MIQYTCVTLFLIAYFVFLIDTQCPVGYISLTSDPTNCYKRLSASLLHSDAITNCSNSVPAPFVSNLPIFLSELEYQNFINVSKTLTTASGEHHWLGMKLSATGLVWWNGCPLNMNHWLYNGATIEEYWANQSGCAYTNGYGTNESWWGNPCTITNVYAICQVRMSDYVSTTGGSCVPATTTTSTPLVTTTVATTTMTTTTTPPLTTTLPLTTSTPTTSTTTTPIPTTTTATTTTTSSSTTTTTTPTTTTTTTTTTPSPTTTTTTTTTTPSPTTTTTTPTTTTTTTATATTTTTTSTTTTTTTPSPTTTTTTTSTTTPIPTTTTTTTTPSTTTTKTTLLLTTSTTTTTKTTTTPLVTTTTTTTPKITSSTTPSPSTTSTTKITTSPLALTTTSTTAKVSTSTSVPTATTTRISASTSSTTPSTTSTSSTSTKTTTRKNTNITTSTTKVTSSKLVSAKNTATTSSSSKRISVSVSTLIKRTNVTTSVSGQTQKPQSTTHRITTTQPVPSVLKTSGVSAQDLSDPGSVSTTIATVAPLLLATMNDSVRRELGQELSDLIRTCTYDGRQCFDETNFGYSYDPTYGNCYIFNSGQESQVETFQVFKAGVQHGLKILLGSSQMDYSCSSMQAGFRLVFHENNLPSYPDSEGYSVPPGTVTYISLTQNLMSRRNSYMKHCVDDVFEDFVNNYTVEACTRLCLQKYTLNSCKCINPFYPPLPNAPYCDLSQKMCMDYATTCSENVLPTCNCPQPCKDIVFHPVITSAKFLTSDYQRSYCYKSSNVTNCIETFDKNFALVYTYYDTLRSMSLAEISSYGIQEFFADFSGNISIMLGLSVFSFVEVGYMIFMIVLSCFKVVKHQL